MLKIIRPEGHELTASYRSNLLGFLETDLNIKLSKSLQETAIFILTEDGTRSTPSSFYGGAVVYKQEAPWTTQPFSYDSREEVLAKLFSYFQSQGEEYWVARIFLCLDHEQLTTGSEINGCVADFYENLYETFKEFGKQENVACLPFILPLNDTYNTPVYRSWPYLLEIRPSGPFENFFYGVLSLNGKKFKPRKLSSVIPFPIQRQSPSLPDQTESWEE